jgi:transposase
MITEQQYRRLMKTFRENGGVVSHAAMKAGMDRETAVRYLKAQESPQERKQRAPKRGRRRPDPLAGGLWEAALTWLTVSPEIEAKLLFEHLLGGCQAWAAAAGRSLRTFQRRVRQWLEENGPPKEVYFPQVREPGKSMQFDWTRVRAEDYVVTINGVPFEHMLTHAVLPYSNWEWATPCYSESLLSLERGVQDAAWQLGGLPPVLQTDCSSAATHQISHENKKRDFNEAYRGFCRYLKVEPHTIQPDSPDQNGDVEAANGHLKRRLKNHLILRGSNDFGSEAEYAQFVAKVCRGANALRAQKLAEELPLLKALPARRHPETQEVTARVSPASVIHVKKLPYSVPSRLIGATLTAQLDEREVAIYHRATLVRAVARAAGPEQRIDYRHVIDWLVRKPGAFANYVYRESLFPDIHFRQAHEALQRHEESRADKRYLKLLQLAAKGSEAAVSEAIAAVLRAAEVPLLERIEAALQDAAQPSGVVRTLKPFVPSVAGYNSFLG